jgi:uncharacterized membrane protein
MEALIALFALVILGSLIALPIIAIVRTGRIGHLERRLARLEASLAPAPHPVQSPIAAPSDLERRIALLDASLAPAPRPVETPKSAAPVPEPIAAPIPAATPQPMEPEAPSAPRPVEVPKPAPPESASIPVPISMPMLEQIASEPPPSESLELVIGRRWIGLVAIALIVVATAFFLKYAFENRWIGELGRVTLGVMAGLTLVWGGYKRHGRSWRYLSEVLTGGGIVILYLSVYGAFAYYHLVDQRTAFVFLAILVVEAHLLALEYDAPSIAVLALAGGFLAPLLLSTGRDQYRVLFTYIGILDLGMLGAVIARSWRWIGSLGYVGTQLLFWGWYSEHYHPEKRAAALLFQTAIFLIFAGADLAPNLRRRAAGWEECVRLAVNPFVFYAICYGLLNGDYHDWMAVLALLLATVYAALARAQLSLCPTDRSALLVTLGTALTFVTLAIPIQLDANWITIAWGVEALLMLWAAFETSAAPLRIFSALVFALAVGRFLFVDKPWSGRPLFTPVFNRYFLGMLALAACLAGAAYLSRRSEAAWRIGLLAFGVFWLGSSFEAYSYFAARADAALAGAGALEAARHLRWAGQLALSLLWSGYAGVLMAAGFRFQLRALRIAGLVLFGMTLVKAMIVDISELQEFYRIVALLMLGLVLLGVAWKYQRSLRREQTS